MPTIKRAMLQFLREEKENKEEKGSPMINRPLLPTHIGSPEKK